MKQSNPIIDLRDHLIVCLFSVFRIHDACKLLVLPLGNALLLTETLKNDIKSKTDSKDTLAEIGVVNISNLMALDILERRNDIYSY